MASTQHQWLLLWLARKLTADGFTIRGFQGPTPQGGLWNQLRPPFEVGGYRPDLWGSLKRSVAFGEAKTLEDIDTAHTRAQLCAFAKYDNRPLAPPSLVYIAVPRSGAYVLDRVLVATGLLGSAQLRRLHVPDFLIGDTA
jgi:hypothetical protein